ncbi:carbohydrate ABC transporter permease [Shinella kummerowiae]|jgi:trehalose/maltose transport system permease protein|uniref:carbohydrate ABC transporter permease n=1 Tax=Shinella kummerowiae TaxID=417745 RepID=UPI0021B5414B|nr:sugar ABC transporter permease [Shinella kummerowiae]MCT7666193.1 sugar ABC transporter permease [Shinella kummerowiae]
MARGVMRIGLNATRARTAWLFLVPSLVVLFAVALWPLGRTFLFSFTDAFLTEPDIYGYVGFENYVTLFEDPLWWQSVRNTLFFTVISVSIETALGLAIALLLNAHISGRGLMRAVILIPWSIPVVVSARMWQWMLHDQFGILNHVLKLMGFIDNGIAWTANPNLVMPVIIAVDVWITTPFMVLLILAGLQMLPKSIYEAASIDGVSEWRQFTALTLPLLAPSIAVAVLFRLLDALRMFDLSFVLSSNSDDTKTVSIYAREVLVNFQDMGVGSAASAAIFLMIAIVTAVYVTVFRLNRRLLGV